MHGSIPALGIELWGALVGKADRPKWAEGLRLREKGGSLLLLLQHVRLVQTLIPVLLSHQPGGQQFLELDRETPGLGRRRSHVFSFQAVASHGEEVVQGSRARTQPAAEAETRRRDGSRVDLAWRCAGCARALGDWGPCPERETLPGGEELFVEKAPGAQSLPQSQRGGGSSFLSVS